jgi:hypothetical protein
MGRRFIIASGALVALAAGGCTRHNLALLDAPDLATGGDVDLAGTPPDDMSVAGMSPDLAGPVMLAFGDPTPFNGGTGTPVALAVGDFDGDGHDDVATTNLTGSSFAVMLGDGKGLLGAPHQTPMDSLAQLIVAADFDSDGKSDLVVSNDDHTTHLQSIDLLISNGNGTFAAPQPYVSCDDRMGICATGTAQAFAVALLDGDKLADVAVSQSVQTSGPVSMTMASLVALLDESNGGFQVLGPTAIAGAMTYAGPIAVGDFDHDGLADVAEMVLGPNHGVYAMPGNGDGTFGAVNPVDLATDVNKTSLAAGDFNNDGVDDLIGAGQTIVVALSKGDGSFEAPLVTSATTNRASIAVADFDKDGNLDAVAPTGAKSLLVMVGKGDGTFTPKILSMGTHLPTAVAVGDFNGDGKPDIAAVDASSVLIVLNKTH